MLRTGGSPGSGHPQRAGPALPPLSPAPVAELWLRLRSAEQPQALPCPLRLFPSPLPPALHPRPGGVGRAAPGQASD